MKPHKLFDLLREESNLNSDAELAEALNVTAPVISRIRSGKDRVGARMIILIHEKTDMPIAEIKELLGKDGVYVDFE
jgi:transcriptional regulator with XRE-family HTH domain